MFTGLVEDTGRVARVTPRGGAKVLAVRSALDLAGVQIGDSIACNGVCLTVEAVAGDAFTVTAGPETLARTTFDEAAVGWPVHLERALRVGDRLGGHWVQGHVDGVGRVTSVRNGAVWIELSPDLSRYVAAKGSVCVDGVSLTVNAVESDAFRVDLIPHTTSVTNLGALAAGSRVNIEVDILAKYVERLLRAGEPGKGLTLDHLRERGFA